MKTTTTETFKYDEQGCLIEKVTTVECDDDTPNGPGIVYNISTPAGMDEHEVAAACSARLG